MFSPTHDHYWEEIERGASQTHGRPAWEEETTLPKKMVLSLLVSLQPQPASVDAAGPAPAVDQAVPPAPPADPPAPASLVVAVPPGPPAHRTHHDLRHAFSPVASVESASGEVVNLPKVVQSGPAGAADPAIRPCPGRVRHFRI